MKTTFFALAALAGVATAQQMDISAINAAPSPSVTAAPVGASGQSTVAFNTAAAATSISADAEPTQAASSNKKRDGCAAQPAGSGPQVQPDTPQNFENYPPFHALANSQTPPYPYVEKFRDLNGSTQQNSYLTYYVLKQYDVNQCAKYCNSVDLCTAFNLYIERDPSVDPGPNCPNPPSTTNYKCALWGSSVSKASATNTGQYRDQFQVVIAGSNGYDKTNFTMPDLPSGFSYNANLTNQAITNAASKFITSDFFPGPYDPTLCAYFATAQTAANRADAKARGVSTYTPANAFNSYTVYKAYVAQGTYCSLFTAPVGSESAGNGDVWSNGVYFGVGNSWTYSLTQQDSGTV